MDRQAPRRHQPRCTIPYGLGGRRLHRLQCRFSLRNPTMKAMTPVPSTPPRATPAAAKERTIKEQVVLVLQGGGALGAYQAGVYQALMERGIEPDWVIGTSTGAINVALIACTEPAYRTVR